MSDLAHRLRESAKDTFYDPLKSELNEAASHIEKLEAEIGVLIAASIRLSSRIDLDSDGYIDRIEKLEAALAKVAEGYETEWSTSSVTNMLDIAQILSERIVIARKALEGKND